ncbi:MAG: host attachment protein [Rhodospirillales bacterium]|nr:host attachment protein [Rhodospirillales bacterium]
MKRARTWILIADGARARVLECGPRGGGLREVEAMVFEADHAATRDLAADRPGRSFSSTTDARSAMEPRSDPHRRLKRAFARRLAAALESGLAAGGYDRLVVVAAPVTMGDLRAELSDRVAAAVAVEVDKDLTKVPDDEVLPHLPEGAV